MSFFKKAMEKAADIGGDVASASKRQAQRGKLELDAKRISGKIDDEKNAIGHLLFPRLQSGQLSVDDPALGAKLASIASLETELAEKRHEIDALKSDDDEKAPAAG